MITPEIHVSRLIAEGRVPALSMAVVDNGAVARCLAAGVRNTATREAVSERTVFEAASLSKPLFAYAVLQLADAGLLSLDEPLAKHVADYISDDPRAAAISARHVLTHTTGLPNWRSEQRPLRTYFPPGERFSYSGEGFVYLQRAVERIVGEPLERLVDRMVFAPLGMQDSSFVWEERFDADYAVPHDVASQPSKKYRPRQANAAYSLHTTAGDYARFLQAALAGSRLAPSTAELWFRPWLNVPSGRYENLDARDATSRNPDVAWGLGWGLEPPAHTLFHWGWNDGANGFAMGALGSRRAIVVFANGDNGTEVVPDIVATVFPGRRSSLAWLGYPPVKTSEP